MYRDRLSEARTAPHITSVEPGRLPVRDDIPAEGIALVVTGIHFASKVRVRVGSREVDAHVQGDNRVTVHLARELVPEAPGRLELVVVNLSPMRVSSEPFEIEVGS